MFKKTLVGMVLCLALLGVSFGFGLSPTTWADKPEYDPRIHVYEEGMQEGVMGEHVKYGTLESLNKEQMGEKTSDSQISEKNEERIIIPMFKSVDENQRLSVEAGAWFYPRAYPWNYGNAHYGSNVRWNSCGGGDDAWVDYYYINDNQLWNNKIRVWADNAVSSSHIASWNGLNGGYYCVGGQCTISVCSTQAFGSNPWSVYLLIIN